MATKTRSKSLVPRAELLEALAAGMRGPRSPVGEPRPLDAAGLRAVEDAAGVALSPSLHALLSYDAGLVRRDYAWFDSAGRFLARPFVEIVSEHAGPFAELYEPVCAARFPGMAIALDAGSDSMRILYFGDPDALGEYPVLFIDHDDTPMLGVAHAGFDVFLAGLFGLSVKDGTKLAGARAKALLGKPTWGCEDDPGALPAHVPGPPPGARVFAPPAPVAEAGAPAPGAPTRPRKLTDKQLDKALRECAEDGNVPRLEELLGLAKERGRPPSSLDDALLSAARGASLAAVEACLAAGASPNAKTSSGSALACVVHHEGAVELARALLDAGADPNGPSYNDESVLDRAVQDGSAELVRALLEAGADPNRVSRDGRTPMHVHRETSGHAPAPDVIDLLVAHGGKPNAGSGASPLHVMIEHGLAPHASRLLAHGADPNAVDLEGATPLHVAYERGLDELVPALVRAGADRAKKDARGLSFEAIWGPSGEDVRPFTVRYHASEESQRVTIVARFAVLAAPFLATVTRTFDAWPWEKLVAHGLGTGALFPPGTGRLDVLEDTGFDLAASALERGFVDRRYVLSCASLAPELFFVIARALMGAGRGLARTGFGRSYVARGVSFTLHGELDGPSAREGATLDGETLRAWLAEDLYAPATFGPLPFAFEVTTGKSTSITIETEDGGPSGLAKEYVEAWLELEDTWKLREGASRVITLAALPGKGNELDIQGFDLGTERSSRRFPFELSRPRAQLEGMLAALHTRRALARVVWRIAE